MEQFRPITRRIVVLFFYSPFLHRIYLEIIQKLIGMIRNLSDIFYFLVSKNNYFQWNSVEIDWIGVIWECFKYEIEWILYLRMVAFLVWLRRNNKTILYGSMLVYIYPNFVSLPLPFIHFFLLHLPNFL